MKIYILRFSDDAAYLEERQYSSYNDRYEYTKNVANEKIFEESQLDKAMELIYRLNSL